MWQRVVLDVWPLWVSIVAGLAGTVAIGWSGPKLTRLADKIADRTGLGEALIGAVLLGGCTSLSGITTTATAAAEGHAELAMSNAIGGIAAQTVFLAVADFFYRKANLEHAAVSPGNLMQGSLLLALLGLLVMAFTGPEISVLGVHPVTPLLVLCYFGGTWIAWRSQDKPMWRPLSTPVSQMEESGQEEDEQASADKDKPGATASMWTSFALLALLLAAAGWVVARSGVSIAHHSGFDQTLVGTLFTAVATSLPELITAIAAVRMGALALAVGGIIGGNVFDTLFAAVADVAYREGSVYHAAADKQLFLVGLTVGMTAVLLMGLLRRQAQGPLGIGWESVTILIAYTGGVGVLWFM